MRDRNREYSEREIPNTYTCPHSNAYTHTHAPFKTNITFERITFQLQSRITNYSASFGWHTVNTRIFSVLFEILFYCGYNICWHCFCGCCCCCYSMDYSFFGMTGIYANMYDYVWMCVCVCALDILYNKLWANRTKINLNEDNYLQNQKLCTCACL